MNFWTKVAGIILRNRYLVLLGIAIVTGLLASQMKYMKFSYTEANLLPEDHEANLQYNQFLKIFGEEGNLVILGIKDSTVFTPKKFNAWNNLVKKFDSLEEIDFTLSIADVQKLKADRKNRKFVLEPLYEKNPTTTDEVLEIKKQLFEKLPFYDNLLFNKETGTLQTAIYIKKDITYGEGVEKFEQDITPSVKERTIQKYIAVIRLKIEKDPMKAFIALE